MNDTPHSEVKRTEAAVRRTRWPGWIWAVPLAALLLVGWWLLRASNTQPVLVARCEAADEVALARVKRQLIQALASAGVAGPTL